MKLRLKYTGTFVTVFLVLAVIFMVALVSIITLDKKIFTQKIFFKTQFADAIGLSGSTQILFKGFTIGRINSFELTEDNLVNAEFFIYDGYQNKIVENSALYKSIDPVTNASSLTLLEGPDNSLALAEGAFIPSIGLPAGEKLLNEGKVSKSGNILFNILNNLDKTLEILSTKDSTNTYVLRNTLTTLSIIVEDLNSIMSKLNLFADNVNNLIEDDGSTLNSALINIATLADEIRKSNAALEQGLIHLDTMIVAYSDPGGLIKEVVDSSGALASNAGVLLEQSAELASTINSEAYKLPILLNNLNVALQEITLTLEALNASPLLNIQGKRETKKSFGRKIVR